MLQVEKKSGKISQSRTLRERNNFPWKETRAERSPRDLHERVSLPRVCRLIATPSVFLSLPPAFLSLSSSYPQATFFERTIIFYVRMHLYLCVCARRCNENYTSLTLARLIKTFYLFILSCCFLHQVSTTLLFIFFFFVFFLLFFSFPLYKKIFMFLRSHLDYFRFILRIFVSITIANSVEKVTLKNKIELFE